MKYQNRNIYKYHCITIYYIKGDYNDNRDQQRIT